MVKKRVLFYSVYILVIFLALSFLYYNNSQSSVQSISGYVVHYFNNQVSHGFWHTKKCVETDRGYDWYIAGENYYEGYIERYEDSCLRKTMLREYYCEDNRIKNWIITCPEGYTCSQGKCQEDPNWRRWNYAFRK